MEPPAKRIKALQSFESLNICENNLNLLMTPMIQIQSMATTLTLILTHFLKMNQVILMIYYKLLMISIKIKFALLKSKMAL